MNNCTANICLTALKCKQPYETISLKQNVLGLTTVRAGMLKPVHGKNKRTAPQTII
jgi:hypothetical protein